MVVTCIVQGCENKPRSYYTGVMFHTFPTHYQRRKLWLAKLNMDPKTPVDAVRRWRVCSEHFTEEDYTSSGLRLKDTATPTFSKSRTQQRVSYNLSSMLEVKTEPEDTPSVSSFDFTDRFDQSKLAQLVAPTPVMLIPAKTDPKSQTKTVSTQLSANILKNHVRSKAVQVRPRLKYAETADVGVQTLRRKYTLPLAKALLADPGVQPKKRPRIEVEEEDKEEEDAPVFKARGSDVFQFPEPTDKDSTPDYEDTKYIVFEKNLRQLFEQCPVCECQCVVQRRRRGTFVSFTQRCPQCAYSRSWQNQPVTRSTPVGDLQLSAAVYFSGESFQKMHRICKGINLQIHKLDTFRKHSQMFLEPAICHTWKLQQKTLFEKIKEQIELPVAGAMRAHPPGPSPKMGSYTTMDLESKHILDVQLVQRKETGNKNLMEKTGLKRSLERLESGGLKVDYLVTDRHAKVQKYLQDRHIAQYYDVWRLEKDLSKRLDELAEKKDFLVVKKWSAAIKHHMYWAAASSKSGEEKVAKWTSQINHMQDIHKHNNPLFPQCAHPEKKTTDPDKWFKPASKALCEVEKLLLDKRVLRDVPNLCTEHQASSLGVFQELSLQFAPDTGSLSVMETKCRLFLAAMHYNENAAREQEMCGNTFLFPKSQQACPSVKTNTTFGYVRDLMKLLFTEVLKDPSSFVENLKTKTVEMDPEIQEMMELQL